MGKLQDKVAIITGAGSGIARAAAKMFAAEGAKVVIVDKNGELAAKVEKDIRDAGGQALAVETDIADEAAVKAMTEAAVKTFGGIDVLFNCAGGSLQNDAPTTDVDTSIWDVTLDVNLRGTFLCCRYAIPAMKARGGGVIVNTSSWAAINGKLRKHIYAAAKGGVISLTKAIAGEYSPDKIRANAICPGSVRTERWLANSDKKTNSDGLLKALGEKYPFSVGDPEDIAAIALFLASDDSRMMTGSVVVADGGRSAF